MSTPEPLGGIHPHLPEVRPGPLPQPDRAAAGPGVAGVCAFALLRQPRKLTAEELARAVRIDPSQIKGLGASLEASWRSARAQAQDPRNLRDRPRRGPRHGRTS